VGSGTPVVAAPQGGGRRRELAGPRWRRPGPALTQGARVAAPAPPAFFLGACFPGGSAEASFSSPGFPELVGERCSCWQTAPAALGCPGWNVLLGCSLLPAPLSVFLRACPASAVL